MERKVSVYVTVPGYYEKFNFLIPETMLVSVAQKLVCEILRKTKQICFDANTMCFLNMETGGCVEKTLTIQNAGIFDGAEFILMEGNHGGN